MGGFGRIRAGGQTMAQFADAISGTAQRVVIDKTGLTGYYDIPVRHRCRRSIQMVLLSLLRSRSSLD